VHNKVPLTGLALGLFTLVFFLAGIGNPPLYILDEYPYVNGARALLSGTQDLNPEHPPLAKFFIATGMKIAGDTPFGWRLAGAVFGALSLVAIFLWTNLLLRDYALALTAAILTIFNNFLFVMARVAMLDVFYFAFVIWGILAFTAAVLLDTTLPRRRALLYSSGTLLGLGTACKWNALVSLAAIALVAGFLYFRKTHGVRDLGLSTLLIGFALVPLASYALAYWPLCHRFHRTFSITDLVAMNVLIWRYHVICPGNPALDVPWYHWFFRASPERGLRYLVGNFVVVWGGLAALAICAWRFLRTFSLPEGMVTLLYSVNLLQWVLIPQKRLVYYYYFPPAMFLGVAIALVLARRDTPRVFGVRVAVLLILASGAFFLFCYPRMMGLDAPYDCMFGCWS